MFFANSGAEAIEGAIKLARRWAGEHKPGALQGRHRSSAASTVARLRRLPRRARPSKQEAFAPMPEGFVHVPANDIVALERRGRRLGGGGPARGRPGRRRRVAAASPSTSRRLAASATSAACLLIVDEIQTGFFRTGPAFAHQAFGVTPDVITVAKALANGLPIGGIVARDEVADGAQAGRSRLDVRRRPRRLRCRPGDDRRARGRGPRRERARGRARTFAAASARSPRRRARSRMSAARA